MSIYDREREQAQRCADRIINTTYAVGIGAIAYSTVILWGPAAVIILCVPAIILCGLIDGAAHTTRWIFGYTDFYGDPVEKPPPKELPFRVTFGHKDVKPLKK
jgi:hypothetical protein